MWELVTVWIIGQLGGVYSLGNVSPMFSTNDGSSPMSSVTLSYHNGPLLTGTLKVHIILYGLFSTSQKSIINGFLDSLNTSGIPRSMPSVRDTWWNIIASNYADKRNASVPKSIQRGIQHFDHRSSRGTSLSRADIRSYVLSKLKSKHLPWPTTGVDKRLYILLTGHNVVVERFCRSSCGYHDFVPSSKATKYRSIPFAWVGNPRFQCPGACAWPFAIPEIGPPGPPLRPPNGDVGIDGMIINLASVLAGAATNPFGTGYYQGDPTLPLEAATTCAGAFGPNSYPGYPGRLLRDNTTKASFNTYGARGRKFLLPALWNPHKHACTTPL